MQFVTSLWASGGFDAIAELHNRELEQLKDQMNNFDKRAEFFVGMDDKALSVVAVCVNNPDCSPLGING
jgi:hypothetical protein